MSATSPAVTGEVVIDEACGSFSDATVRIRLEDTTYADAATKTIAETVIPNINHTAGTRQVLPFTLSLSGGNTNARYEVRSHVDLNGSGRVCEGNYVTMESYPVLTHGYPAQASARVRRVD